MTRRLAILLPALVLASAGAGFLLGRSSSGRGMEAHEAPPPPGAGQRSYTCSMHPQVRLDRPGKCPICGMPLIPADAAASGERGEPVLELSERALAMAGVETTIVERREVARELRAVGKAEYNESSLATITARVDGYAERLFVNFTGVELEAGDHLAEIYSPELLVAQQELLIALQSGAGAEPIVEGARLRLQRLGLTGQQIQDLVERRIIADRVTLLSPIAGTVIEKAVLQNSAFRAGDALYRIANLDSVWIYLDVYEYDLAWLRYGQEVEIAAEALPGRTFAGMVTFVQPLVNEQTRTIRVPIHVENPDHALKPGMFVTAAIRATLDANGLAAPTGVEGRFSCPMHPQVLRTEGGACPVCEMPLERIPGAPPAAVGPAEHAGHPGAGFACPMQCEEGKTYAGTGACPVCGMDLEPVPSAANADSAGPLVVPASSVLDGGTRRLVYVEKSRGLFEPREVTLGPRAGDLYPVLSGLAAGERVVTRGGFLIDSQFQITGHPSLFHPGGAAAGEAPPAAAGHAH